MEEIIKKKKLNKKPLLICLAIAFVFAVIGFIDIKSNAAESVNSFGDNEVVVYLNSFRDVGGVIQQESDRKFVIKGNEDIEVYYYQSHTEPTRELSQANFYVVSNYPFEIIAYGRPDGSSNYNQVYDYDITGSLNNCGVYHWWDTNSYTYGQLLYYHTFVTDYSNVKQLEKPYNYEGFLEYYLKNELEVKVDYNSFEIDDDMPIVENVVFDRLETREFNNGKRTKKVIDYIRFQPNSDYKLMIMLCPSVYSSYGSKDYVADFKNYEYPSWIYMCVADKNLKEISCDLGTFLIPTDDISDIKSSDYYMYYDEILNSLPQGTFKPTMGYRLAYVDVNKGLIGPSTYIKPLAYNSAVPDMETYSYFTLYSDGSRNTEKIMNLKTWTTEYDATTGETSKDLDEVIQDMKDTVVNVGDYLKDKVVVDSNVDVQEATNWLYSVVNFIKGTPQVVGSVLGFLPQPILYGMYVCIFLGIIASGLAIVKALL